MGEETLFKRVSSPTKHCNVTPLHSDPKPATHVPLLRQNTKAALFMPEAGIARACRMKRAA